MEYPRFVYISPGKNKCQGGSFDCEPVNDEKEHEAALTAGYSDGVPEALEAGQVVKDLIKIDDEKPVAKRGRPAKE